MIHVEEINQLDAARRPATALECPLAANPRRHLLPLAGLAGGLLAALRRAGSGCGVLVVRADGRPLGILPLVVQRESTRVGRVRTLTYPLHDWGTFYGPIGPNPTATLLAGLRHVAPHAVAIGTCWTFAGSTPTAATGGGPSGPWSRPACIPTRKPGTSPRASKSPALGRSIGAAGRRNGGTTSSVAAAAWPNWAKCPFLRYRPAGAAAGDGDPRWDLYDACVDAGRGEVGKAAPSTAPRSAARVCQLPARHPRRGRPRRRRVDLNLLLLDGRPVAFAYNYVYRRPHLRAAEGI